MTDSLSIETLKRLSHQYGVSVTDATMITMNTYGAHSKMIYPRLRMDVRPIEQSDTWKLILPLDNDESPFEVTERAILLDGVPVAEVEAYENDDVVLTYLRNQGQAVTLNTHSRSKCVGCVFCPNIIEESADDTLRGVGQFESLFHWMCADNAWQDLSDVDVITVCSGCFASPGNAIRHLSDLRQAATNFGFIGTVHLLSSVIREREDLEEAKARIGDFHLTLTFECFSRRDILLKSTKASLTAERAAEILHDCTKAGIFGDFTYIVGLDDLDTMRHGLSLLGAEATTFPRIQIYQAHNDYMRCYRHADAENLEYYFDARLLAEAVFGDSGLRPKAWENYRPLWYKSFKDESLVGPRI